MAILASNNESVMPPQGTTGLAMMTPIIGFPIFFHAVSGMMVTGIGVIAFNNVFAPLAEKVVELTQVRLPRLMPILPISMPALGAAKMVSVEVPVTIKSAESSEIDV